jgi:hypothetical protein
MAKLQWDAVGARLYETGTAKGVLFVQGTSGVYEQGVAWNGLSSVKKSPDGAEESPIYADNKKYLSLTSAENLKGSIDAYTYPEEFEVCDGSAAVHPGVYVGQQPRRAFGMVYSTIVGNDTMGNAFGEKLHFMYNVKVAPSERAYETVNDEPAALTFSWEFSTTPVDLEDIGLEASAGVVVSRHEVSAEAWTALTERIYGTEADEPSLPSLQEVIALTEPTTTTTTTV